MDAINEEIWGTYLFYVKKKNDTKAGNGKRMKARGINSEDAKSKIIRWLGREYGKDNYILSVDGSYGLLKI